MKLSLSLLEHDPEAPIKGSQPACWGMEKVAPQPGSAARHVHEAILGLPATDPQLGELSFSVSYLLPYNKLPQNVMA